MPTVNVDVKSFEFGTKLVATFVVEQAQYVERFILLPTVDSIETSSGKLTYDQKDQLLGLCEYHGTIGPDEVSLHFTNGVRISAKLKTPMDHQTVVGVTEHDTTKERESLNRLFGRRMGHIPMAPGLELKFEPTHVYIDYALGPSPFFWPFRLIPQMATGTLTRTDSSCRFIAKFDINGVVYEFTADMVPSIQKFESTAAVLTYQHERDLIGTQVFQGVIGITAASITFENGVTITATLDNAVDPASTICGAGHWTQA